MKLFITLLSLVSFLFAEATTAKVVIDLSAGNISVIENNILKGIVANKNYYENEMRELEVAVVIHGKAYKFFVKDIKNSQFKNETELVKRFDELKKRLALLNDTYDVKFYICGMGMASLNLTREDIVDYVQIVPTSTMAIIDKQNEGFAYYPFRDKN